MVTIQATWQLSASIAGVLATGTVVVSRVGGVAGRLAAFGREFALVVGLFAVYQYCGHYAHFQVTGAVRRARQIADLERTLHLPPEVWVQRLILPHPLLVRAVNSYYESIHLGSLALFLVWIWWRHGERYARVRNVIAASTLGCLFLQMIPVAPPRLTPGLGFVDTALAYGQSVYGPFGAGIADQLAAMPSIHILWASIIAGFAVRLSTSRWRWLLVAHLALTWFVVVASANHWWLDGVVAVGVLGVVLAAHVRIEAAVAAAAGRWRSRRATAAVREPALEPAADRS